MKFFVYPVIVVKAIYHEILNTFEITVNNDTNGVVTSNLMSVEYGASFTLTITPNPGFKLASLKINEKEIDITTITGNQYEVVDIRKAVVISATFIEEWQTVTHKVLFTGQNHEETFIQPLNPDLML